MNIFVGKWDVATGYIYKRLNELRENERSYEFLTGVDDMLSTIRTYILTLKPMPTLGSTHHLVVEDRKQRLYQPPGGQLMSFFLSKLHTKLAWGAAWPSHFTKQRNSDLQS